MKKILFLLTLLSIICLFQKCAKEPIHNIRIYNGYKSALYLVEIGSVSYGTIINGEYTVYKYVEEGSHSLIGYFSTGEQLSGVVSVAGKGTHKWTLEITYSGGIIFKEN